MIREPTKPSALDIEEFYVKQDCHCILKPHLHQLPICSVFNDNHPIASQRGIACGTKIGEFQYCGHARECHGDKP